MPANNTVTLALEGQVTVSDFATAMQGLSELLVSLEDDVSPGAGILWIVAGLEAGSALGTMLAVDGDPEGIQRVIRGYGTVGHALERREPPPFSERVMTSAARISSILNGRVPALRFETYLEDAQVTSPTAIPLPPMLDERGAYGMVRGRMQTLTNRNALRFTMYDTFYDRAVSCYLPQDYDPDALRTLWGKTVAVEGWIKRDTRDGHPVVIRRISNIVPVPEREQVGRYDYIGAQGILKGDPDSKSPEDIIRRLRNAW